MEGGGAAKGKDGGGGGPADVEAGAADGMGSGVNGAAGGAVCANAFGLVPAAASPTSIIRGKTHDAVRALRDEALISLRSTPKKNLRRRRRAAIIGEDRFAMARPWKDIGRYGSVGIEFVLTILICSGIGYWWDGRHGRHGQESGWGLTVGFLIGVAVGFYNLFKTAQGMQRDIERAEANDPLPPGVRRWNVDEGWLYKPDDGGTSSDAGGPSSGRDTPDGPSSR